MTKGTNLQCDRQLCAQIYAHAVHSPATSLGTPLFSSNIESANDNKGVSPGILEMVSGKKYIVEVRHQWQIAGLIQDDGKTTETLSGLRQ